MNHKIVRPKVAYVRNAVTKEYYTDGQGNHRLVSISEAIKTRQNNKHEHNRRHYMSLNANESKRYRLRVHTVREQFERDGSEKRTNGDEFDRNYDESMSHKCVVEALSRMTSMSFKFKDEGFVTSMGTRGDNELHFDFDSVNKEPYVKLPNGNIYYPDILCTFDEHHPMYDQWGGKLAIEVTYTHGCESYKQNDFMFHNIPVVEFTIEEGSARQFPAERPNWNGGDWGEELVESHIQDLMQWFESYIVVKPLVDPVSTRVHEEIVDELNVSLSVLNGEVQTLEAENIWLSNQLEDKGNALSQALKDISTLKSRMANLQDLLLDEQIKVKNLEDVKSDLAEDNELLVDKNSKLVDKLIWKDWHLFGVYILLALVVLSIFVVPGLFPEAYKSIVNWLWGLYH
ncbi:hypothetical protein OPW41_18210 [Vibrio europaeus]|uniref:hypothetical protein n=1 Tax=Vibrio europaeus TaxID=300876 RepID=UPI00233EE8DE|nr:hypothetical protein [Vibrio europaeus]MDC5753838.1 hypothetical protein [Vibrio europaeus]MDC5776750.1 hypothetical protein [Vibrio europaeus]MDC5796766.1 hypothetical protein [Vibrio europaeus]MDC5801763.1 hypothetical protein [Vibrio europaeus]MDC5815736.1 hypothetical protein [Vibrio europaeus]